MHGNRGVLFIRAVYEVWHTVLDFPCRTPVGLSNATFTVKFVDRPVSGLTILAAVLLSLVSLSMEKAVECGLLTITRWQPLQALVPGLRQAIPFSFCPQFAH